MYISSANLTSAGIGSRSRKGKNNFEIGTITIDQKQLSLLNFYYKRFGLEVNVRTAIKNRKDTVKGFSLVSKSLFRHLFFKKKEKER